MTLVYDIGGETKRLLTVECKRTEANLRSCFENLGESVCPKVQYVCSDMWKPYLNVIAERLGEAVHVLDRFHVMQQFSKALDEVRAEEAKRLVRDGYEPVLRKSRWCLLKRRENLTDKQTVKLSEIQRYNLRTVRAYLLREEFVSVRDHQGGRATPGARILSRRRILTNASSRRIDPPAQRRLAGLCSFSLQAPDFAARARRSPRAHEVPAATRPLRQHRPAVRQFDWRWLARR
jgi:transposase